jgi:hypothetical protein
MYSGRESNFFIRHGRHEYARNSTKRQRNRLAEERRGKWKELSWKGELRVGPLKQRPKHTSRHPEKLPYGLRKPVLRQVNTDKLESIRLLSMPYKMQINYKSIKLFFIHRDVQYFGVGPGAGKRSLLRARNGKECNIRMDHKRQSKVTMNSPLSSSYVEAWNV